MRNNTRALYTAMLAHIAQLNGVDSAAVTFSVDPTVQQRLEAVIQESSEFLQRINMVPVIEQQGAKVGIGVGSPIASTRNTAVDGPRVPRSVGTEDSDEYHCQKVNFDTALRYAKLDAWAHKPEFETLVRNAIARQQALDRILIGWNGTSRAATSNLTNNPLLQDVSKGWLQKYRERAPERVMDEVVAASNKVYIGTGANTDYKNLDALVMDAVASMVAPWYRNDPQMVAIIGRDLLHDKYFPLVNRDQAPSEQLAADVVMSQKRVGGVPALDVPFFPAGKILVTRLDNLSIYWQESARRRRIVDNAAMDQIEDYQSSNEDWVVEDYAAGTLIENIHLLADGVARP